MSRVDFYFIPQTTATAVLLFACRLLEKAYQQKHQIYVHSESPEQAKELDSTLWTFRDDSFIPHELYSATPGPSAVQIGCQNSTVDQNDILLNLHPEIPPFHSQFKRILQIIPQHPSAQTQAQEHRAFYAKNGYTINEHQLTK